MSKGYKSEVLVNGKWTQRDSVVWPDMESAEKCAADLWSRWALTADHRGVAVNEEPTESHSWDEHIAIHGTPPRIVRL